MAVAMRVATDTVDRIERTRRQRTVRRRCGAMRCGAISFNSSVCRFAAERRASKRDRTNDERPRPKPTGRRRRFRRRFTPPLRSGSAVSNKPSALSAVRDRLTVKLQVCSSLLRRRRRGFDKNKAGTDRPSVRRRRCEAEPSPISVVDADGEDNDAKTAPTPVGAHRFPTAQYRPATSSPCNGQKRRQDAGRSDAATRRTDTDCDVNYPRSEMSQPGGMYVRTGRSVDGRGNGGK